MTVLDYVRELVALTGVSGAEEDIARAVARLVRPLVDTVELDALGTVIATRQATSSISPARTLVLAAHIDEVGARIAAIEPDGFLRFDAARGLDSRILLAQRVYVQTAVRRLLGVIGTRSAHLLRESDRASVPAHSEHYIDIGAQDADDARRMGVRVGDTMGFVGELTELGHQSGRYVAHALDDRAGCAVLLALLAALQDQPLPVNLTVLFTVQEEVGLRGAQAARAVLQGTVALAIDMTALDDTPEVGTKRLRLGHGPAIKVMDFSQISHPALRRGLEQAAATAGVAVQQEILMGIGTDAGALQFAGSGIPTAALSVGNRYTHSPVEVLDSGDLQGAVTLLQAFITLLPELDLRFTAIDA